MTLGKSLNIHPIYQEKLAPLVEDDTFEGALDPKNGERLISINSNGLKFQVSVEPEEGAITQASYLGVSNPLERGLLNKLCQVIVGATPQEVSDHGPIQVEWELRKESKARVQPGLVTPENADPAFKIIVKICREILAQYNNQVGNTCTKNYFDRDHSHAWVVLSDEERLKRAWDTLKENKKELNFEGVEFCNIKEEVKIDVTFPQDWTSMQKQEFLLEGETYLRENLERDLQLFAVEKQDANKLRHKNQ